MRKIIDITEKLIKEYDALVKLSKDNFNQIKNRNIENQGELRKRESATFKKIEKLNKSMEAELPKNKQGESIRLTDYIKTLYGEEKSTMYNPVELNKVEASIQELLEKEKELREQLNMNIELSLAMQNVHAMKMEVALELAKEESDAGDNPLILDENY